MHCELIHLLQETLQLHVLIFTQSTFAIVGKFSHMQASHPILLFSFHRPVCIVLKLAVMASIEMGMNK